MLLIGVNTFYCVMLCIITKSLSQVSTRKLTLSSGSFSTPTFPSSYPPATEYIWLINAEDGMYIRLTFDVIDIEAYRGRCIDIVEIKDGDSRDSPLIAGFCNANKPTHTIMSSSNDLRIWFQSARNSDGGAGFNASYMTVKEQGCGGLLKSFPGSFSTPRYPSPYPSNRECVWNIMAPPGMYIYLAFHGVYHLEYLCFNSECECIDELDIKDGEKPLPYPPYNGYCFTKPRAFTSKTNIISVKFVSDRDGRYEGFNATYSSSLTPGCGADLHHAEGVITSPNYPHSYHSFIRCIWRITVPRNHYISLIFHTFDVNVFRNGCFLDSLEMHDGYTTNSRLLAKLCNANTAKAVNSTGHKIHISFQAGINTNHAKGFKLTYSSYLRGDVKKRQPRHKGSSDVSAMDSPANIASILSAIVGCKVVIAFFTTIVLTL